jgi:serine/threonine protein kinase
MDQAMQQAISQLLASGGFHGRIVTVQEGYMMVEEEISSHSVVLADFIAKLPRYTELQCRNLFRKIALAVQSFHVAGLAHRNLHPSNFVVDQEVRTFYYYI